MNKCANPVPHEVRSGTGSKLPPELADGSGIVHERLRKNIPSGKNGCITFMDLILAMDLRHNQVVHGKKGERESYKPLDWGLSPTADPIGYVNAIRPKYLYIADLDRIEGTGSHDTIIRECAGLVTTCYVDRGCRSPDDILTGRNIVNITGTETGGNDLFAYKGGFLSLDIKNGVVIPYGTDPVDLLRKADSWNFSGCILLNITSVGTETGVTNPALQKMRAVYRQKLFYGGGVGTVGDLETLAASGFDGAIVATAIHRRNVPVSWIQEGYCC